MINEDRADRRSVLSTIYAAAGLAGIAVVVGYAAGHHERRAVARAYVSGREDGNVEGFDIGYRARDVEGQTRAFREHRRMP